MFCVWVRLTSIEAPPISCSALELGARRWKRKREADGLPWDLGLISRWWRRSCKREFEACERDFRLFVGSPRFPRFRRSGKSARSKENNKKKNQTKTKKKTEAGPLRSRKLQTICDCIEIWTLPLIFIALRVCVSVRV